MCFNLNWKLLICADLTFFQYDVNAILEEAGDPLRQVRKSLRSNAVLLGAERKLMMRTLTKHLYYDKEG